MKLSTAIEIGSKKVKPCRDTFFDEGRACPIGTAALALGYSGPKNVQDSLVHPAERFLWKKDSSEIAATGKEPSK